MQHDRTSAMAVFEAIAACGEVSRARIAQMTGFSQVTVGKAVDLLDTCGIISQYKQERASAGRKTGICRMRDEAGMLLLDFDAMRLRVVDITLNVRAETDCGSPEDALMRGFSCFADAFGGELMGIGCVVPDGCLREFGEELKKAFGNSPELLVEAGKAAAYANAARFEESGTAIFLRIRENAEKQCGGAIMMGGRLYGGISGRAGDFAYFIPGAAALSEKLAEICALLDPALIHIASDNPIAFDAPAQTQLMIEPLSACRDALDGAALMLRKKWVSAKMEENG